MHLKNPTLTLDGSLSLIEGTTEKARSIHDSAVPPGLESVTWYRAPSNELLGYCHMSLRDTSPDSGQFR
jgi:hypothetical protein